MNWYWSVGLIAVGMVNLGVVVALFFRVKARQEDFRELLAEFRRVEQSLPEQFRGQREESSRAASALRQEVSGGLELAFRGLSESLERLKERLGQHLEKIRDTVDGKLNELQSKNEQKLEQMRQTVDEKLATTLERRVGESFKLVSERLEQVHKGLGEMQAMASSVGDLKRVLSNVKARGTWGEIQLGALLEDILTPGQFERNVMTVPGSGERVEFAMRLPGNTGEGPIWLPLDAKFPQEDYQRLVEAIERGDANGVVEAGKAMETRIRLQARTIRDKYIGVPHTTDFGIMFLPSEGLYAEVLRRPGLADNVQREFRILITGPTTLAAFLNSLQIGFRTLAIQERASEVWKVLGAVKTEFGKFGGVLAQVKKKLDDASNQIEETEVRTRAITRKLRDVEALPAGEAPSDSPEDDTDTIRLGEHSRLGQNSLGI